MKFKTYIAILVIGIYSTLSFAGNSGGTGNPFPTDGSVIQPGIGDQIIISPNDVITDLVLSDQVNGLGNGTRTGPILSFKDLSNSIVSAEDVQAKLSGYAKLNIVSKNSIIGAEAIAREDVVYTFSKMKKLFIDAKQEQAYIKSVDNIKSGQADVMFVTDEEDKIILMDSSKIK